MFENKFLPMVHRKKDEKHEKDEKVTVYIYICLKTFLHANQNLQNHQIYWVGFFCLKLKAKEIYLN